MDVGCCLRVVGCCFLPRVLVLHRRVRPFAVVFGDRGGNLRRTISIGLLTIVMPLGDHATDHSPPLCSSSGTLGAGSLVAASRTPHLLVFTTRGNRGAVTQPCHRPRPTIVPFQRPPSAGSLVTASHTRTVLTLIPKAIVVPPSDHATDVTASHRALPAARRAPAPLSPRPTLAPYSKSYVHSIGTWTLSIAVTVLRAQGHRVDVLGAHRSVEAEVPLLVCVEQAGALLLCGHRGTVCILLLTAKLGPVNVFPDTSRAPFFTTPPRHHAPPLDTNSISLLSHRSELHTFTLKKD